MNQDLPSRRILLALDNVAAARRIRAYLTGIPSYRVAAVSHLTDAEAYLAVDPVDIVLAGPTRPKYDLSHSLDRVRSAAPGVPVVALLADDDASIRSGTLAAYGCETLSLASRDPELWCRTVDFVCRHERVSKRLAAARAKLGRFAATDPLTELPNRKGLESALGRELVLSREDGRSLLAVLVDLDDFARVNALLGHAVGDLVLVGAARRIEQIARQTDVVGRLGEDRFLILLPGTTPAEGADLAEQLRLAVAQDTIQVSGNRLPVTASVGISTVGPDVLSLEEVVAGTQIALERSKAAGKNRVTCAPHGQAAAKVYELGPGMVQALLHDDVLVAANQPIVDLTAGKIVAHEMLTRGPEGPLRQPDQLFRYSAEQDILTAVDLRSLKQCAAAAARLADIDRYHVNIMPATLLETPEHELIRVLTGVDGAGPCCLEISEQQLLGDPACLRGKVLALQRAGITVAIDDVGFGSSCLEGLLSLTPDVVKIDKRLVRGLSADPEQRADLVRLLRVADVLRAEVIAEGIEHPDDLAVLLELGVRYGQGFLFGRPCLCAA